MNLIINNPDDLDLNEFCKLLIEKMQDRLKLIIDKRKLILINNYLNSKFNMNWIDNEERLISAYELLISASYNLRIRKTQKTYVIEIDPNSFIPNSYAKFINIIKLINYGNLSFNGYPIYDTLMQYFADNLEDYYNDYILGEME